MLKRATKLSEIPQVFQREPLAPDEFEEFYVTVDAERDNFLSRATELKINLEKENIKGNIKILFAGHRGSGKSTELNRLIKDIGSTTFIVKFSVFEELDVVDLNYIDLVMVMMEQLAYQAEKSDLIDKNSKNLEKIKNWLADVTDIKVEETGYMLDAKAGVKADKGILSSLIGLIAEFKAVIKAASSNKTEYRLKIEKKIALLTKYCNLMINEITQNLKKQGKKLLIVIEDIDKVEIPRAHEIFFEHSGILYELNVRIIFTVSIVVLATHYRADITDRFKIVNLPMLKTTDMDGNKFDKGYEVINEIVKRRADLSLFAEGVLEKMIERSGGVLKDLFAMIEDAANSANDKKFDKIEKKASDGAFDRLKQTYHSMITVEEKQETRITTDDLYDKLKELIKSKKKKPPLDKIILLLLSCLAVVEYNGKQWFDVHPAVKSLLKEMGKLDD